MRGAFGGFNDVILEELEDLGFEEPYVPQDIKYARGNQEFSDCPYRRKEGPKSQIENRLKDVVPPNKAPKQEYKKPNTAKNMVRDKKRSVCPKAGAKPNPKDSITQGIAQDRAVRFSEFDDCPDGYYFCTKAQDCVPIPDGEGIMESGMRARFEYHEQYNFAQKSKGRGKPCGASHISASYNCTLGAGERKSLVDGLVGAGATRAKIEALDDTQLSRVSQLVKERGLSTGDAQRASATVEKLKGEKAGGKKQGGANLQDPEAAGKYADFYEAKKDLTYKAPFDTDPKVARATLDQLRDEDPAGFTKTMDALSGKGSPSQDQLAKAGWESRRERGEAVLKSLMDNDFKDINGDEASWRQGLQLDHKRAGSTGGSDRPDNWIWISTASNQAKGGMEAAARRRGLTGEEAENYIRNGLVTKLRSNQRMSAQDVAAAKGAGSAKVLEKKKMEQAMKDNLPLMTTSQRGRRINDASGDEIKTMLKASVNSEKNPVTGRAASYRPVLTGGGAERVRKAYGTVPEMKSLMRVRWGQDLDSADLRNIGGMLKKSTGSKKSVGDKLDELLGNFPPTTGLTAAQRIEILDAAA